MRLLYLITRAEAGGAQAHLLQLLRHFKRKFEVILATGEEGILTTAARDLGITVHVVPALVQPLHPLKDMAATRQIYDLLRSLKPDLVHVHSSKAGLLGRIAARVAGIPSVFTAHGWAFAEGVSWKRLLVAIPSELLASGLCNRIITVSDVDHALALRYSVAPPEKLITVHNGMPDTSLKADPSAEDVTICMVARFASPKAHDLLLKALATCSLPFRLSLVGDGPLRPDVERLAEDLGIRDRVNFLGNQDDVSTYLAAAQVFVLASRWEGLPISIIEAMRAGLPVVATRVGGIPELVQDGVSGYLVEREDEIGLRDALIRLIADSSLRLRMGREARLRYLEYFHVDRMLDRIDAIYHDVLGTTPEASEPGSSALRPSSPRFS